MQFNARKSLLAIAAFVTGLALAVAPTLGANMSVTSGPNGSNTFSPKTLTVNQGESVTWANASGTHNVKFDDGSFEEPASATSGTWMTSRTFNAAGSFRYYCELHGGPGGSNMSGTVVVNPASGTTPPPGGGGGGGGGSGGGGAGGGATPGSQLSPVAGDTVAPKLTLSVRAGQRILKARALVVEVSADEKSIVTATARITLPGASKVLQLKKVTRVLQAGERSKLKLRLSRKTRASVASALRHRSRLKAKVTVSVRDGNGNSRSSSRSVKVKR